MLLPDEQTLEFAQAQLKLRDGLQFTQRETGEDVWYLVEDEMTGRFFQIGLPQYMFLSLLNGRRTVSDVLTRTASLLREHAIDQHEAASICQWAIESGLVETELSNSTARRAEAATAEMKRKSVEWLNPISFKVPLMNPDSIITIAERYLGWLISPGGLILWLIVVCYGMGQLAMNWQSFVDNRVNCFERNDLVWMVVTWLILKLFHEFAHSLVCKRFGGRVRSCGILLLLLIPMPFVDVTSSWRFENKWKRILTAAAGMLSELFIAAVAACVYVFSDPGPLQYHAGNVIISATLHTFLFNANPLMRFDGYYMLADWVEIPNLYTHGRQYVKSFFKWIYFGAKAKPLQELGVKGSFVKVYGFLVVGWFFSIAVALLLGAFSLLEGFGLIVAVVGGALWLLMPVFMLLKYLIQGTDTENPNRIHFAVASGITAAALAAFFFLVPGPSVISAPVVIDYDPLSVVRAKAEGFAQTIHVHDGEAVVEGQRLVTLENPELISELDSLLIDIRISQLRADSLLAMGDIASLKLENESLQGMTSRRDELSKLVSYLEVRADQDGIVLARDLASIEGTWFKPGDEMMAVGLPEDIHAIALARQEDVDWIEDSNVRDVELRIWGRAMNDRIDGEISRINPRARDDLAHDAFAATSGGPLAVVPRGNVESTGDEQQQDSMMLVEPRVPLKISVPLAMRQQLASGQTGVMKIRSRDQYMGAYLLANFTRFIRRNTFINHGL